MCRTTNLLALIAALRLSTHVGFDPLRLQVDVMVSEDFVGEACIELEGEPVWYWSCWTVSALDRTRHADRSYTLPFGGYKVRLWEGGTIKAETSLVVKCGDEGSSNRSRCEQEAVE